MDNYYTNYMINPDGSVTESRGRKRPELGEVNPRLGRKRSARWELLQFTIDAEIEFLDKAIKHTINYYIDDERLTKRLMFDFLISKLSEFHRKRMLKIILDGELGRKSKSDSRCILYPPNWEVHESENADQDEDHTA